MKKRSPPSKKALKKIQRIQDAARKKDAEDVRKVNKQLKTGNTAAKRGRPKGSKNKVTSFCIPKRIEDAAKTVSAKFRRSVIGTRSKKATNKSAEKQLVSKKNDKSAPDATVRPDQSQKIVRTKSKAADLSGRKKANGSEETEKKRDTDDEKTVIEGPQFFAERRFPRRDRKPPKKNF
ncbi:unnamed protein product [Oikopleura dioica]|uniref:Uncharacterized protein n=1 Tax=Oikopleura dioica TaxID=34765 RepID=E4YGQ8_OIKDI|nr:unnamed protein product [Oikopleura dioica]